MKILYVSCHGILEYDELRMFHDIGAAIFSIGSYISPSTPHASSRPALSFQEIPEAMPAYHRMCNENRRNGLEQEWHSKKFTEQFLNNFDVIIIMHIAEWIVNNWEVLKGRNVIWRTIGQSTSHIESKLRDCRKEGLKIVRYSPMEQNIPGFIGEDALIRFGKYKEDFKPWVGDILQVITIGQSMKARKEWCNYDTFVAATWGLPHRLYGYNNEPDGEEICGYDKLVDILSRNRAYFYTGTKPASYTLNFIEAALSGTPIVSIGRELARFEGHDYFEVSQLLEKYKAGYSSDDVYTLHTYIQNLLTDEALAKDISLNVRAMAVKEFDAFHVKNQWKEFLQLS